MDAQIVASWIVAAAAIIYTIGTFLLWWTTRQTLQAMRDAFKLNFLLACSEAGSGGTFSMRLAAAGLFGDPSAAAAMRDRARSRQLEKLLKRVFPSEFDALVRGKESPGAGPQE